MRVMIVLVLLLSITCFAFSGNRQIFPDILKPEAIHVYDDELFIIEGASISIYSLRDFRLIKKFGEKGEGPMEFKLSPLGLTGHLITLNVLPKTIVVSSENRIAYFSRQGKFLYEKRTPPPMVIDFTPLAQGFVGQGYRTDGDTPFFSFNIYDEEGHNIKELCKYEIPHYKEGTMVLWKLETKIPEFKTYQNTIFVAGTGEFLLDVYDAKGNKIREIKQPFHRRNISSQDREEIIKIWKQDFPVIGRQWDTFRKMIDIQGDFPAFATFFLADDQIYLQTCNVENSRTKFIILHLDGTVVKQVFLPLGYRNMLSPFPYTIKKNRLYQLLENEKTETWELVVTPIQESL